MEFVMKFRNPVIPGFYPDPSVCRVGEDFYLVTSTFEYFPGVPVFHSRNLVDWKQIGHCLTRPEQLPLAGCRSSGGIYAPTIRYHEGRFYMVTTNVTDKGHFYVYTDDPTGEWSDPIWVGVDGDTPGFASSIDSSLFFDDDGKVYFTCNERFRGIIQFEIDIETGRHLTEKRFIWEGTGGGYPEAPHLYKINGLYYLLIAEGGTHAGHMVTIARSDNPYGPFAPCPHNPILTHRSSYNPIQATGHAELFEAADGSWWQVCLAIRPQTPGGFPAWHNLGRETFLAPVQWTDDGWPVFGNNGMIALEMEVDHLPGDLPPAGPATHNYHDDFILPELDLGWNFLRNPHAEDWSLEANPGTLQLNGSALTLNEVASPAFIGRRQQHHHCHAETGLRFNPARVNEEAGLTAFMNERHHYDIAITRRNGQRSIIVRCRIGSLSAIVAEEPLTAEHVILAADADDERYVLSYGTVGGDLKPLASGEARHLSTEVAGGFTGVYFGLYATGNGQRSTTPANFDYFEYRPTAI
jgi:xylan 1,4-beta-xylosidase